MDTENSDWNADLLSSVNVEGDVAYGWVQIMAVSKAEASDVYAAMSGPPWWETRELVFPLSLLIRGHTLKMTCVTGEIFVRSEKEIKKVSSENLKQVNKSVKTVCVFFFLIKSETKYIYKYMC